MSNLVSVPEVVLADLVTITLHVRDARVTAVRNRRTHRMIPGIWLKILGLNAWEILDSSKIIGMDFFHTVLYETDTILIIDELNRDELGMDMGE